MESQHELDTNSPSDDASPVEIILDKSASIEVTGTLSQCHPLKYELFSGFAAQFFVVVHQTYKVDPAWLFL